ncbi:hypothetical protein GUITHDRAFT_110580 [Guillardia theta CCMP2712]|uniref:Uncharacterized protein n=1 Tax=Guillardia theta (strain CCMP2712) TaxID=905079 RepID=L1J4M3_GUITC|nr:hypothetical protein GUITHDRAFT_110580 [Guillardia theta CCMP2712]EKX43456.1 hypothetical protein GUITHDRAFT_110580 [Guillardia theta CCMP2712]|eukprot:XP_005830436.1 hypothetical protein GUITHDRAFT_110580 [Guillardia theta CCMP2712]
MKENVSGMAEANKSRKLQTRSKKAGKPLRRLIKWSKNQGDLSLHQELFAEAITHYSTAINAGRSAAHLRTEDYKAALEDAEKSVSLKPKWSRAWVRKSEALDKLGESKRAQAASRQAAFWGEGTGLAEPQPKSTENDSKERKEFEKMPSFNFSWISSWRSLLDSQLLSIPPSGDSSISQGSDEHTKRKTLSRDLIFEGLDADESILELDKRLQEAVYTAEINSASCVDAPPPTPSSPDTPKRVWDFLRNSSSPGVKQNPDSLFGEQGQESPSLNASKKSLSLGSPNLKAKSSSRLGVVLEGTKPKNVRFPENEVQSVWIMSVDGETGAKVNRNDKAISNSMVQKFADALQEERRRWGFWKKKQSEQ